MPDPVEIPDSIYWYDAFIASTEAAAEVLADKTRTEEMVGTKLQEAAFDIETYRARKAVWKRVRRKLVGFSVPMVDLEFSGCVRDRSGNFFPVEPVAFYRGQMPIPGMVFPGEEATVICNFLTFYFAAYEQGVKPQEYIKSVLANQGITAENFDRYQDKLMIDNPWKD